MASSHIQPILVCFSLAISRIFLRFWTAFFLIYFLLIKECFETFFMSSIKFKENIIWLLQQISIDNLWTVILEEAKRNHVNSLFFIDSTPQNTPQNLIIQNKSPSIEKEYKMYMCESCRNINRYFFNCKYFKFKTPILLRSVSPTQKCSSCSSPELHRTVSEPHLNFQSECRAINSNDLQKESFESLERFDLRPKNIKKRILQFQDVIYHSPESQNSSNDSMQNSQIRSESSHFFKAKETINQNEMQRIEPEIYLQEISLKTPTKSEVDSCLETPPGEFNFFRRQSKIRLLFSNNKYTPEIVAEDSFLKKIWNKWISRRSPVTSFELKQNANEIPLTSTIPGQTLGLRKSENKLEMEKHGESFLSKEQTPEKKQCCTNMFINLKSRFNPNFNEGFWSYRRF